MKSVFIAFVFYLLVNAETTTDIEWEAFKKKYNRTYANPEEDAARELIFNDNQEAIKKHNEQGESTFRMKMNHFGDLTVEEWNTLMNGYKKTDRSPSIPEHANTGAIVKAVDWRIENRRSFVTRVENQNNDTTTSSYKYCYSCWAFSAAGSTESIHAIKTGKLVSLSKQNLIDCPVRNAIGYLPEKGCEDGEFIHGFDTIIQDKGINTEESYPYQARDDTSCRYKQINREAKITGYVNIAAGNELDLRDAVAQQPVSVTVVTGYEWDDISYKFYNNGTLYIPNCSSTFLHAVVCVGYGKTKESGEEYWLIKNSYGESWGERGYFKLARNKNNLCGIATHAAYPVNS